MNGSRVGGRERRRSPGPYLPTIPSDIPEAFRNFMYPLYIVVLSQQLLPMTEFSMGESWTKGWWIGAPLRSDRGFLLLWMSAEMKDRMELSFL